MSKFTAIVALEIEAPDIDKALEKAALFGDSISEKYENTKFVGARVHLDGEQDDEPLLHVLDK